MLENVLSAITGKKSNSKTSTAEKAVTKATRSATSTLTKELTCSILGEGGRDTLRRDSVPRFALHSGPSHAFKHSLGFAIGRAFPLGPSPYPCGRGGANAPVYPARKC